ncbi:MAG: response regulator [Fuerstiella sp.]
MSVSKSRSRRCVLVADDDRDIRRGLQLRLCTAGYTVVEAKNGREALELARRNRPDVILMDIRMPELDGLTAMKRLQEAPETASIPVIVMSASLIEQDRAMDCGAVAFIGKPHNGRELMALVDKFTGTRN